MRQQSRDLVTKLLEDKKIPPGKVLDVGSFDVSGNIRGCFNGWDYVGVDMRQGPNVSNVINAHQLDDDYSENEFDMVVCFDTLEHDDRFWDSIDQMKRVLKSGGYLVIGVPGRGCPLHSHPDDYWRFMEPAVKKFFDGFDDVYTEVQKDDGNHDFEDEVYGYGKKV